MRRNYKTVSEWKKAYRDKEKLMNDRGYHEVQPREFYRAIFPAGSLQSEIGDGKGNIIASQIRPKGKGRTRQWIVDDSLKMLDKVMGDSFGLKKLLKEVKANRIACIIVKDMSRFSRDYIEMGTYLNQIFPFMGIRFIAINDHYDSRKHHGNAIEIDTAFQTLIYDLYSKDISVKIKASFENKCADGEYVFGQVPFGYEKSRKVKNTVVVNEREAEVVRYIFSLALGSDDVQGKSSTQIARQLYEENVPTITQMRKPDKKCTDGKVHSFPFTVPSSVFCAIKRILRFLLTSDGSQRKKRLLPPETHFLLLNGQFPLPAPCSAV